MKYAVRGISGGLCCQELLQDQLELDVAVTESSNLQHVKDFINLIRGGGWQEATRFLHEDVVIPEAPSAPYPGEWRGHAGFRALGVRMQELWERDWDYGEYLYAETEDGVVFKQNVFRATSKISGRKLSMPVVEVFQFKDGLIVENRPYYWDTKGLADVHDASTA